MYISRWDCRLSGAMVAMLGHEEPNMFLATEELIMKHTM